MKQQIEEIIKKNFYKEFKGEIIESFRGGRHTDGSIDEPYDRNIEEEIDNVIIPLIADEVLKVVVENMQRYKKSWEKNICGACGHDIYSNHIITCDCLCKIYRNVLEDLLSNLSPNKENKNNE